METRQLPRQPISFYGVKQAVIGCGAFGTVYRYQNNNGVSVAIKKMKNDVEFALNDHCVKEIVLLNAFSHPNVMRLIDVVEWDTVWYQLAIVMELAPHGDLESYAGEFSDKRPFEEIKGLLYDVACGLSYLHANRIIHGDVKAKNILIFDGPVARLSDFGSAIINVDTKELVAEEELYSGSYRPPEIILRERYGYSADVWAYSVLCYDLLVGTSRHPLFEGNVGEWYDDYEAELFANMVAVLGTSELNEIDSERLDNDVKKRYRKIAKRGAEHANLYRRTMKDTDLHELLDQTLIWRPEERLTINEICEHPFFASIRDLGRESAAEHSPGLSGVDSVNPDGVGYQDDIDESMRTTLISWLIEISRMFRLEYNTLHLGVGILDRILSVKQIERTDLQRYGCAAMHLATPYDKQRPTELQDWVFISDNSYTAEQLAIAINDILLSTNADLLFNTPEMHRRLRSNDHYNNPFLLLFVSLTHLRNDNTPLQLCELHERILNAYDDVEPLEDADIDDLEEMVDQYEKLLTSLDKWATARKAVPVSILIRKAIDNSKEESIET